MAREEPSARPPRPRRRRHPPHRLSRGHARGGGRGGTASARHRHGPGERAAGPPRARLPRRLHPVARAVAQGAGQPLRRARAVRRPAPRRRPGDGDRGAPPARILDGRRQAYDARGADADRPPGQPRRQTAGEVRPRRRSRCPGRRRRRRGAHVLGRPGRAQAGAAQPGAAVHDVHPAAGSLAQARLPRRTHDAGGAAPLRGRRHRRRDRRPHHLHAHRRGDPFERGGGGDAARDRAPLGRRLPARDAAALPHQGAERPGSARSDPPDRPGPPSPPTSASARTRNGCTT